MQAATCPLFSSVSQSSKNINDSKPGDIKILNKGNHNHKLDSKVLLK